MKENTLATARRSTSFGRWLKKEHEETKLLLKSVPAAVAALFAVSLVCMNLLANKTLVQTEWIALDAGILISWLSFMCMDLLTKHFGPKAADKIAVLAMGINLFTCLIFYLASIIPSNAMDYSALNGIFGGTWFILMGSTAAFLVSAVVNNRINWMIGKLFVRDPDGKLAFAVRTYLSTFIGQFLDNFIFSVLVFTVFAPIFWNGFHWTYLQCFVCALTGAAAELLMEMLFSPIGYKIVTAWKEQQMGKEYLAYLQKEKK